MFLAWGRGGQERLGGRYQVRENSPPVKSENMQLCALMCVLPKMKAWGSCSPAGQEDSGWDLKLPLTYSQVAIKWSSHFISVSVSVTKYSDGKQPREEREYFSLQFRGTVRHGGEVKAGTWLVMSHPLSRAERQMHPLPACLVRNQPSLLLHSSRPQAREWCYPQCPGPSHIS